MELFVHIEYDKVRKRDFFVRNAGISSSTRRRHQTVQTQTQTLQQQQQPGVRPKPSHSWRDGNADAEILHFPGASDAAHRDFRGDQVPTSSTAGAIADNLDARDGLQEQPTVFDEIDFFTTLFGKQFVDTAWVAFADRSGPQIPTKQALDERFTRLDQRKVVGKFPPPEFPVTSFAEFLSEYVKSCVTQHQSVRSSDTNAAECRDSAAGDSVRAAPSARGDVVFGVPDAVASAAAARSLRNRSQAIRAAPKRVTPEPGPALRPPKALAHVQSKIKPELDARREKLLRVKKTQTQLMKESLARTRLAEYEAKRMLDAASSAAGTRRGGDQARKLPLADITTGALWLKCLSTLHGAY